MSQRCCLGLVPLDEEEEEEATLDIVYNYCGLLKFFYGKITKI
jgi:hypothetical protein